MLATKARCTVAFKSIKMPKPQENEAYKWFTDFSGCEVLVKIVVLERIFQYWNSGHFVGYLENQRFVSSFQSFKRFQTTKINQLSILKYSETYTAEFFLYLATVLSATPLIDPSVGLVSFRGVNNQTLTKFNQDHEKPCGLAPPNIYLLSNRFGSWNAKLNVFPAP